MMKTILLWIVLIGIVLAMFNYIDRKFNKKEDKEN